MKPLTRQQIVDVIEGRGNAPRVPVLYSTWMNAAPFGGDVDAYRKWIGSKVCDVNFCCLNMPGLFAGPQDAPEYRWAFGDKTEKANVGLDSQIVIEDWSEAEEFYAAFPDAEFSGLLPEIQEDGRYVLVNWWYTFFERHWSLRGMENALFDFFDYPEEVHRLYSRLTDYYLRLIERAKFELGADGFFISDDLGSQKAPLVSPYIFEEFLKPYYIRIAKRAHELGMHFWLHTCGNVTPFMEDFIGIGLDVIHPIQKRTMDAGEIAKQYGGRICILAGFDVQRVIPYGTEEDVRAEVRWLIDTYSREDGRFMLTMGNGATEDWKVSCLDALYEETLEYGKFAPHQTLPCVKGGGTAKP